MSSCIHNNFTRYIPPFKHLCLCGPPSLRLPLATSSGVVLVMAGIVFAIAATILIYEYNRTVAKEEAREAAQEQRLLELDSRVEDLRFTVDEQGDKIRELSRLAESLDAAWKSYQQASRPSGGKSGSPS